MKKIILLTLAVCCFVLPGMAQEKTGDIVLDAMRDELRRSMQELRLPELEPPFFMMYGIDDQKRYGISASLGAITISEEQPMRLKTTTRLLVGDYAFNDESLDETSTNNQSPLEIGIPLDNDYPGIRRSLWSTTDNVYRNAARHFQKNQQTLKESGKTLETLTHRTFAKSDPVKLLRIPEPAVFNKKEWEARLRNLSALFSNRPLIQQSSVSIHYMENVHRLVSSEGTIVRVPENIAMLWVLAQARNENGEIISKRISHIARTPDGLPSEAQCVEEITKLIKEMEEEFALSVFEDEYSGPVLFLGVSAADLFVQGLLAGRERIVASDNIPKLTGYQYNLSNELDGKIGKNLVHESLTVKAKPSLRSYNGTDLLGSFEIDREAIVPAPEVVVFDRGVLKELLNNRNITHSTQKANGFASGPGVLEITSSVTFTEAQLKAKLIETAKKQGLEYAVIFRSEGTQVTDIYTIAVVDGKEQKLRNARPAVEGLKTLKKILGTSARLQVVNSITSTGVLAPRGGKPPVLSVIAPSAVLVEDMDVKPLRQTTLKEEQYVSRPGAF